MDRGPDAARQQGQINKKKRGGGEEDDDNLARQVIKPLNTLSLLHSCIVAEGSEGLPRHCYCMILNASFLQ
jgi:hypothetical protein